MSLTASDRQLNLVRLITVGGSKVSCIKGYITDLDFLAEI